MIGARKTPGAPRAAATGTLRTTFGGAPMSVRIVTRAVRPSIGPSGYRACIGDGDHSRAIVITERLLAGAAKRKR
jgi:hypothetical protein